MNKPETPQIPLDPMFEQLKLEAEKDKDKAIMARLRGETALNNARYGTPTIGASYGAPAIDPAALLTRYGTQMALAGTGTASPLKPMGR